MCSNKFLKSTQFFLYWVSLSFTNTNEFLLWSGGFWNTNIILQYMCFFLNSHTWHALLKYTLVPELTMFSLLLLCKNSLESLDFCLARWSKNYKGLTSPQSLKMNNFQYSKHHGELVRKSTKIQIWTNYRPNWPDIYRTFNWTTTEHTFF